MTVQGTAVTRRSADVVVPVWIGAQVVEALRTVTMDEVTKITGSGASSSRSLR